MLRFDRLETPSNDGDVLIEPPAQSWPALMERTVRERAACQARLDLAGVPIATLRHETRQRLIGSETTEPVIACGHQPEFVHPGVWAKHVVVHHFAERYGLPGLDLVVDNDAPRTTSLIVPSLDAAGHVVRHAIGVLNGVAGSAYEGRPPLSPSGIESLLGQAGGEVAAALGGSSSAEKPMLGEYCRGLASAERPRDFVDQHLAGRARVDRMLAADLREARVSAAFDGPFVADILLNLDRFAQAYNASLADYRRDQHVRSPDRPLPDLKRADGRTEAPFWVYAHLQQRRRLFVAGRGDELELFADDRPIGVLSRQDLLRSAPAALASLGPWLVRPRALTLTLWARLVACDLFVHGIGGAKYDRVNDSILRRYYHCEPPAYACVTATLRMPLPRKSVEANDLREARRRLRDWRFNPQRYLDAPPADLIAERERLIETSRRLRDERADSPERRHVFHAIGDINARLNETDPAAGDRLADDLERTRRDVESNAQALSREFFYCLQPQSRLETLAARLVESAESISART